ncbi:MAG: RnfABCDGE type electron transport complex subunit D [Cyanobacteria bacterium P01_F01_bin.33]
MTNKIKCGQVRQWFDARDSQIGFLVLFLMLGVSTRDWTLRWDAVAAAIAVCVGSQLCWTYLVTRQLPAVSCNGWSWRTIFSSLRSATITSLSLCLLLRANSVGTIALAAGLAISSKFLVRVGGKHVFNPANFGIIAALLLTADAWVSPGQWGTDAWLILIFAGAGGLVLRRVGRWDTSATFLGTYALLVCLRNTWLGWEWDAIAHHLSSGSLLLFALFMLTDPRTIPNARTGRELWAAAIALASFVFQYGFYIQAAPFWALFAFAPLTPLFDRRWPAPRFTWSQPSLTTAP